MVNMLENLKKEISLLADPKKAEILKRFFKTGKGQYGEGDIFLGIQVPDSRKIAKKYSLISMDEIIKLLKSPVHEERLIAIMATFNFIKKGKCEDTLKISKILLNDKHDLIHKAVGWMLREVGKRCSQKTLTDFLDLNLNLLPRTTLRYAIERLP